MPSWMFGTYRNDGSGGGVPSFQEVGQGASPYTYGYYLDPQFKIYFTEMVQAFAKRLRIDLAPTR
jgi:hypothetical protein